MDAMVGRQLKFDAIGTSWLIDIYDEISDQAFDDLATAIAERIETFDQTYSRFRADSLITKISQTAGHYDFPADAETLFNFYRQLYDVTGGLVTPLVGNVLDSAGYDADYSLTPDAQITKALGWDDVMSYEHPVLNVKQPVLLDFGAAGKGYLIDIISWIIEETGVTGYMVDGSGDILRKSAKNDSIRVGLEHPTDLTEAIGVAQLGQGSICASAGNRRQWAGLHHIMNPYTATPVSSILSTWVMAESTMLADGLATALFFTDPETLRAEFEFEYCLIRDDLRAETSKGFKAEIFETEA